MDLKNIKDFENLDMEFTHLESLIQEGYTVEEIKNCDLELAQEEFYSGLLVY